MGEITLQDDSGTVLIELENCKSFGRVAIVSAPITLQVDVVLSKKDWKVFGADYGTYSYINLKFVAVYLTPETTGILGATQVEDFTFDNASLITHSSSYWAFFFRG